ncbi:hypothetical protein [Cytobacillus sp. NCCP-133]|uniref:hypothetical protein n=1 Tax=Cytobacillus sp. NCCP-133 TaxID=766848 RepID=UPI00222FA92F|nr:hypothetical protein [Cytobacillus sp. NCCP-133]GLB58978.1 hypothetical protein NCCP133_11110 [Cytobacillus sp. NCCP-133]
MIYDDGVQVDENMRVVECPRCENEVFSTNAGHCKICGISLYNVCEGEPEFDSNGYQIDTIYHQNPGDARFCESCGRPTTFNKTGILKPWDVVREQAFSQQQHNSNVIPIDPFANQQYQTSPPLPISDDDLPF